MPVGRPRENCPAGQCNRQRRAARRWHLSNGIDFDTRMATAGDLVVAAMLGEVGDMPDHPR